jgi:hypothetical protein
MLPKKAAYLRRRAARPAPSRRQMVHSVSMPIERHKGKILLEIVMDDGVRRQLLGGRRMDIDISIRTDARNIGIDVLPK